MNHIPLGRFDTVANNAISGHFTKKGNSIRMGKSGLSLTVNALKSDVPLRDSHMKTKYLEFEKFPRILLTSFEALADKGTFTATLKVRDKSRKISGIFEVKDEVMKDTFPPVSLYVASVNFRTTLSALEITPPTYMNIGVGDEFEVILDLYLTRDLN